MPRLADLIHDLPVTLEPPGGASVEIHGVAEDSRTVTPGVLFIARPGGRHDGSEFIDDAIRAGAVAILITMPEMHTAANPRTDDIVVLRCADAREVTRIGAIIAERFHGSPARHLRTIGVTGTNGKSTIVHMVHRLLKSAGIGCGLIGTVEIDNGQTTTRAAMTTPPAVETSRLLASMVSNDCQACAMEVSSHALHQGRCDALRFECAVFTNLTGDHLDYHHAMDEYARCKAMLFDRLEPGALAVVNADDPAHERMVKNCKARVIRTSLAHADTQAHARLLGINPAGTHAIYHGAWGMVEATSPFIGAHNVSNALQAMVVAHHLGLTREHLQTGLERLTAPAGRLECVSRLSDGVTVLVDYAHSDDSLAHAIEAVRPIADQRSGRVVVVFGCGGDRDKTKRPRMGRAAINGADLAFITSDNPRTEHPEAIIDDIRAGMSDEMTARTRTQPDRRRAIYAAIEEAHTGDVVLITGKGHEDYQILPDGKGGTVRIDFDDRAVAGEALAHRRRTHASAVEAKPALTQGGVSSFFWTPAGIARATGGRLIGDGSAPLTGVCTDTRAISPGCVFVALVGERFDAHDFIGQAVAGYGQGPACVVAHRDIGELPVPLVRVGDTGAALMDMGAAWRHELTTTRIIGVTGSNGKTTTCRMIDAVLSSRLRGRASIRSFNNAIGVPLTVLGAKQTDDYLVAEAGMNAPGEMAPLSHILAPDIAVITSIGRAHIGGFADRLLGIAREKAALASHLAPGGVIVASADSSELRQTLGGDRRVVWVGGAGDAHVRVTGIETQRHPSSADGHRHSTSFMLDAGRFTIPAPGAHNAFNAAMAVVVARMMGLDDEIIRAGLASFAPAPMRLEPVTIGGITIINDAYNANPESMIAALEYLASSDHPQGGAAAHRRKVAVLGQMLEMGDACAELHAEVGRYLSRMPGAPDLLITVGVGAQAIGQHASIRHEHFETLEDGADRRIASMLEAGDLVLLKGSRGVGLERVIPAIGTPGRCSITST